MITVHSATNYTDDLYEFLKEIECSDKVNGDLLPYFDTNQKMKVTIGVGFNIEDVAGWLFAVLKQFGLDTNDPTLTTAQRAAEQKWYAAIGTALQQNYFLPNGNRDSGALQAVLDDIMSDRAADPALAGLDASRKRGFFNLNNGSEVRSVYNSRIGSYEHTLDMWLTANGINQTTPDLMLKGNMERSVLLSLTWQGWIKGARSSPKLANALSHGDRAEAWYEIRYNTNSEARRILEADTFGLFNFGVETTNPLTMNDTAAKAAFRAYTRHRAKINVDEQNYVASGKLNTAIVWGNSLNIPVRSLQNDLQGAAGYLLARYASETNDPTIAWDHI